MGTGAWREATVHQRRPDGGPPWGRGAGPGAGWPRCHLDGGLLPPELREKELGSFQPPGPGHHKGSSGARTRSLRTRVPISALSTLPGYRRRGDLCAEATGSAFRRSEGGRSRPSLPAPRPSGRARGGNERERSSVSDEEARAGRLRPGPRGQRVVAWPDAAGGASGEGAGARLLPGAGSRRLSAPARPWGRTGPRVLPPQPVALPAGKLGRGGPWNPEKPRRRGGRLYTLVVAREPRPDEGLGRRPAECGRGRRLRGARRGEFKSVQSVSARGTGCLTEGSSSDGTGPPSWCHADWATGHVPRSPLRHLLPAGAHTPHGKPGPPHGLAELPA